MTNAQYTGILAMLGLIFANTAPPAVKKFAYPGAIILVVIAIIGEHTS